MKRFKEVVINGQAQNIKNEDPIKFDLDLNIKDIESGKNGTDYELYAITAHFGTMTGGHYTAFVKSPHSNFKFADK